MKFSPTKISAVVSFCLLGLSSVASAAMDPQVEKTLVAVCKAGASNNMITFNNTMKDYRINESRIFPRLVCNGESFHQFAVTNNADRTANRISQFTGTVTIKDLAMTAPLEDVYVVNF